MDIKPLSNQCVRASIDQTTKVEGIGTVCLCVMSDQGDQVIKLKETLYVPELKNNLISVSKADS